MLSIRGAKVMDQGSYVCTLRQLYMENISKEKNEIQGKLEKHRRKAQKSLIKLEQHETSIL